MNKKNHKAVTRSDSIFSVIFVLFAIVIDVFAILFLHTLTIPWVTAHVTLFSVLLTVLVAGIATLSIYVSLTSKKTLTKTFFSGYLLVLVLLILAYLLQITGFFAVLRDAKKFQEYLERSGSWMPLAYILFQYLQVVILPIPAVVSTGAGVALFGPFYAMLYSLVGIVLGSLTAFFIGRKLGVKAVSWIIGEDTLEKWQTKLKGKDNLVLTMMFLLPLFPDDVLCFIAGLSSMTSKYFCIMICISRILSVSTTCYSLDLIPFNTLWGLAIWAVIVIAVVTVFLYLYRNLDKVQAFLQRFTKKSDEDSVSDEKK